MERYGVIKPNLITPFSKALVGHSENIWNNVLTLMPIKTSSLNMANKFRKEIESARQWNEQALEALEKFNHEHGKQSFWLFGTQRVQKRLLRNTQKVAFQNLKATEAGYQQWLKTAKP